MSKRLGARALANGRERRRVYTYISIDGCVALRAFGSARVREQESERKQSERQRETGSLP